MKVKYFVEIFWIAEDGRELVNQLTGKNRETDDYIDLEPAELQRTLADAVQRIADKAM